MGAKLSTPRRVDRFAWNFGGYLQINPGHCWGIFPHPIGTSKPEVSCFSETGSRKYLIRKIMGFCNEVLNLFFDISIWSLEFRRTRVYSSIKSENFQSLPWPKYQKSKIGLTVQNCILAKRIFNFRFRYFQLPVSEKHSPGWLVYTPKVSWKSVQASRWR